MVQCVSLSLTWQSYNMSHKLFFSSLLLLCFLHFEVLSIKWLRNEWIYLVKCVMGQVWGFVGLLFVFFIYITKCLHPMGGASGREATIFRHGGLFSVCLFWDLVLRLFSCLLELEWVELHPCHFFPPEKVFLTTPKDFSCYFIFLKRTPWRHADTKMTINVIGFVMRQRCVHSNTHQVCAYTFQAALSARPHAAFEHSSGDDSVSSWQRWFAPIRKLNLSRNCRGNVDISLQTQ